MMSAWMRTAAAGMVVALLVAGAGCASTEVAAMSDEEAYQPETIMLPSGFEPLSNQYDPVSYTHLTLPTIYSV